MPPEEAEQTTETTEQSPEQQAAESAISSAGGDLPFNEAVPEKFRVFEGEGDDATFNLEASSKKLLDSYTALEKNNGAPESVDAYSIESDKLGEDFSFDEFKKDETNQAFLKRMHAAGINNKQLKEVLEYGVGELIPSLMSGNQALTQDDALSHMKSEVWSDPAQYNENMALSGRAYSSLPEDLQQEINNAEQSGGAIGNHPVFLKVMALFGKEMGEDTPPSENAGLGDSVEIEKLMLSDAYKDSKHPEHEKVSKQVKAYFESKHPAKAS